MAFSLNVGSVTNLLRFAFPMSLKNANTKMFLPCAILDISETETNQIPTTPQDSNVFVGDTIIKMPKRVTCNVFVYSYDIDTFETMLEGAQISRKGFNLNGVYKSYFDLRLTEKIVVDSPDMVGGTKYTLTFDEILIVSGTSSKFSIETIKNPADSVTKNAGTQQAPKLQSLAFKGLG